MTPAMTPAMTQAMTPAMIQGLVDTSLRLLPLAACLVAGCCVGALYFFALWGNTRLLVPGRFPGRFPGRVFGRRRAAIVLALCRVALLALALALIGRQGAWPLLSFATGLLAGRAFVLRRCGGVGA